MLARKMLFVRDANDEPMSNGERIALPLDVLTPTTVEKYWKPAHMRCLDDKLDREIHNDDIHGVKYEAEQK